MPHHNATFTIDFGSWQHNTPRADPAVALVVQITNLEVDQKAQARRGTAVSAVCD